MRRLVPLFAAAILALPATSAAQEPVDTTGRDTTRATQLPELNVTVTRTTEPLSGCLSRSASWVATSWSGASRR